MPSKHTIKMLSTDTYYHVFNRGVDSQNIFKNAEDYIVFLSLLKRHLSTEPSTDRFGRTSTHLLGQLEINAFCLMPNHFHFLVYNIEENGLPNFMRTVMTSYSMYFNRKYKRKGTLYQGTYKASLIDNESYLLHISRYIHLNPQDIGLSFQDYKYSSYSYYLDGNPPEWLYTDRILELHDNSRSDYESFVKDYESARAELKDIRHTLADA